MIYSKFLEYNSLTKTETYLLQNGIKTKNGRNYTRFSIKGILQNPVYVVADNSTFNYFKNLGIEIYSDESEFNGKQGVMAYNKTLQRDGKSNKTREFQEWIVAVGKHKPIIESKDWITHYFQVCFTVQTAVVLCDLKNLKGSMPTAKKYIPISAK